MSAAGPLHGRREERHLLDAFMADVRDGRGSVLVIVGEAGIGKTRLLDHVAESVAGPTAEVRIARTAGAEAETHLSFAGLHRLLRPFLDRVERLPGPQHAALATAFGLAPGTAPDLFLVGLAVLTLLAGVAAEIPLVCLIDDAHWLDRESLTVLAFLGRRLGADGIGLLVGTRDEPGTGAVLRGLRSHPLGALTGGDAVDLLAARTPGRLDPQVATRIVAETGGNPLALVETTAALSREQLAGASALPELLPFGPSLEAHFAGQVLGLPGPTRRLLLLIAVAPGDDQAVLWRAAGRLGLDPAAADPALAAGVLRPGRTYAIRHPLIRSAVYATAAPVDRRAVHAALGAAIDRDHDPESRAWQLAESVAGVDAAVADELEQAAGRARRRGGYAAEATFLTRAAELTPDPQHRARRFLAATGPYLRVGDNAAAIRRLDQAAPGLTAPVLRAAGQRLRAAVHQYSGGVVGRTPAILLAAVTAHGPLDDQTVRDMLWDALSAGILGGSCMADVALPDIAKAALRVPGPASATMTDRLLDALATRIADDYSRAVPLLRAAVEDLCTGDLSAVAHPAAATGSWTALDLWDDHGYHTAVGRMDEFCRRHGALHTLKSTLSNEVVGQIMAGRFAEAAAYESESAELDVAIGLPSRGTEQGVELLAWLGREDEARASAAHIQRVWVDQLGYGVLRNHVLHAMTVLDLSLGRYREAVAGSRVVVADDLPGEGNRRLYDAVEAGVRGGDRDLAEAAHARLARRAPVSGTPWALGALARSTALLGEDEAAYRESIDQLGRTTVRTELARSHLLYGEWLRRRGRRTDAREQLRTAYDMFAGMGAAAFAERARVELKATGETARRRSTPDGARLTPQELQVATLAGAGNTNAEIATRLFVTASTVEYHLTRIFRKLGVTSRRQLGPALRDWGVSPGRTTGRG
ncbi:LuxR family transcriptional regulator [Actinoplanes sp. N902-109]|uniref:helix-turn-helix transcriptional regulator n=1 Tax=Actinoplanes sp. (strain N902-109) TaxID=649831 RepID=UPI00032964D8|nr:LuxR family transcriptional regulator [Actinoplanes sp. N902-109]AGL16812.1 LuxR family transcriptional regulator [Actinoplanes sp. N902-109]